MRAIDRTWAASVAALVVAGCVCGDPCRPCGPCDPCGGAAASAPVPMPVPMPVPTPPGSGGAAALAAPAPGAGPAPAAPLADAQRAAAMAHLKALAAAVDRYVLETGGLPASLDDLTKRIPKSDEPFVAKIPLDPWGAAYAYVVVDGNAHEFRIATAGADAVWDTADDLQVGAAKATAASAAPSGATGPTSSVSGPEGTWVLDFEAMKVSMRPMIEAEFARQKAQLDRLPPDQRAIAEKMLPSLDSIVDSAIEQFGQMSLDVTLEPGGSARFASRTGDKAESGKGTWRLDGVRVVITTTETNGRPATEAERRESPPFTFRGGRLEMEGPGFSIPFKRGVAAPAPTEAGFARFATRAVARMDMKTIITAIDFYYLEHRRLPTSLDELTQRSANLDGPFLKEIPLDPWKEHYEYRIVDARTREYRITSAGEDRKWGSADDLSEPEPHDER